MKSARALPTHSAKPAPNRRPFSSPAHCILPVKPSLTCNASPRRSKNARNSSSEVGGTGSVPSQILIGRHGARPSKSIRLNSREQRHGFAKPVRVWQTAPFCICQRVFAFEIQLIENLLRGSRKHRRNKNCD